MARPLPQHDEAPAPNRQIPSPAFASVSTRIIASVFMATVLTAAAVSGLCIRAIHGEQQTRLTRGFTELIAARETAWNAQRRILATLLRAEAAPGTTWSAAMIAAREAAGASPSSALHWQSPERASDGPVDASLLIDARLPEPPAALAPRFDRITLVAADRSEAGPDDCLAIETELPGDPTLPPARLVACVAEGELAAVLGAGPQALAEPRMLLTDLRGEVLAAGGPGAPARVGARIPIGDLIARGGAALSRYSDPAGRALVGIATPLDRSGYFLAVETEHARAFASAIGITRTIFVVDVCIILFFSVLAYQVTVAIMQPIHALSSGAKRILDGHIDHQIPAPAIHDDELGLLTHTFNEMMRKLRTSQIEIERDRIRLAEKNEELQSANEVLSQLSITDGLTKLHNHRYFQDHLTREIKRVSRTHSPLSLILIDIDDFKQLNDTHGHAAGDEVLITLATIMNESARESDLIARYGGEEFVILMPNTDLAGAVHLAEKIRMAVESTRLIIGDRMKPTVVTISLGVALFKGNRREFFAEADRALYRAKAAGKNCVIIAGSESNALG
ncbi:diguanylate cyclase [Myxococcota bacterium]|nr:diguanylate cyclase [Myxococcota bacterium]